MATNTWRKTGVRYRFTSANGWEEVQTWQGRAGEDQAEFDEWMAGYSGYTSLEVQQINPLDNGDAEMRVDIGYGVTGANGERLDPTDPDYGLISRKWTLHTNRISSSLLAHPSAGTLHTTDAEWPDRIRANAIAYAQALRAWVKANMVGDEPDRDGWRDAAAPTAHTVTTDEAAIVDWLFREFAADEDASYDVNQPVLRKTEVVIAATRLEAVHDNVDRFHDYAALQAAEASLSVAVIIAAADLGAVVWLKGSPEVEETSEGRFQIVQEWEGWRYVSPNALMRYGAVITG